jgi:hypothetical protein
MKLSKLTPGRKSAGQNSKGGSNMKKLSLY